MNRMGGGGGGGGGAAFNVQRSTDDGTDHIPVDSALHDVSDSSPLNDVTDGAQLNDATTTKVPTPYRARLRSYATNKIPVEQIATTGTASPHVSRSCATSLKESDRLVRRWGTRILCHGY